MKHLAICVALAGLCWVVYGSVGQYDFVNYDDRAYLIENDRLREGLTVENANWAFTTVYHSNWHPLTWLSWMLEIGLFDFAAAAFARVLDIDPDHKGASEELRQLAIK